MKNIFVVDDDINIGNMLEELLVKEGCRVTRAYSGTEALLALPSARPDLVLLDLMLPGLDGKELLPQLKGIPVIVVSARAGVEDKVDLLLGGAADYVTKPFDTRELLARIAVQLRNASAAGANMILEYEEIVMDTGTHSVRTSLNRHKCNIMEYVLATSALSKHYKHFKALNGLDMHVPKGAIYGFVGKNGAGKMEYCVFAFGFRSALPKNFRSHTKNNISKICFNFEHICDKILGSKNGRTVFSARFICH